MLLHQWGCLEESNAWGKLTSYCWYWDIILQLSQKRDTILQLSKIREIILQLSHKREVILKLFQKRDVIYNCRTNGRSLRTVTQNRYYFTSVAQTIHYFTAVTQIKTFLNNNITFILFIRKIKYSKHCFYVEYKYFRLQLQIKCPMKFTISYLLRSYSDVKTTSKINSKFKIRTSIACFNSEV